MGAGTQESIWSPKKLQARQDVAHESGRFHKQDLFAEAGSQTYLNQTAVK